VGIVTALIVVGSVLGYLALTLFTARWRYRAIRPYTEPLACTTRSLCGAQHFYSCYRRWGMVETKGEAVLFALLTGIVWPFILPAMLVARVVVAGGRQLPEELAAEIKRLEAENDRLKRQQEGAS
jgi:hypothetical protein